MSEHTCPACQAPAPNGVICWECNKRLIQRLGDLEDDVVELRTQMARQSRMGRGVGSRAAERPLPYDERASDLLGDLRMSLVGWIRIACENDGDWPADLEEAMIERLRRQAWATHPASDELLADLDDLHSRILRCIDIPPERRYLGPCASTDQDGEECTGDVYAVGNRIPTCRACGASYSRDERQRWIADMAGDQLVTASEAAGALSAWGEHITADLVRTWAFRGRLLPRGHDMRSGHPVYAFSECRVLALATVKRRGERSAV